MTLNLENIIGFAMARTQGKIRALMIQKFKEFDLTPTQWAILTQLSIDNGIPPTEISKITFKDIPNTIRMLQKLEKKELVYHHVNPYDKRVSLFYLSDKGVKLRNTLLPIVIDIMNQAVKGIDSDKVQELIDLLNLIYQNLAE